MLDWPGAAVSAIAARGDACRRRRRLVAWRGRRAPAALGAGGVVYAGALLIAPVLLRRDPQWGFMAMLFLFVIVWATDIIAYFFGRAVGGPKLWPRVSPNKTWSGAIGGLAAGVAACRRGRLCERRRQASRRRPASWRCVLSVLAQAGDLFESAVKRRFGAKDASQLIPGHGGSDGSARWLPGRRRCRRSSSASRGRESMPRRAASCYGRPMKQT